MTTLASPIRQRLCAAALGAGVLLAAPSAGAYAYQYTCGGSPIEWESYSVMARDQCSMPDGSDANYSYNNAGWQWTQSSWFQDYAWTYNSGCTITFLDGLNETALVDPSEISGANGLTTCYYGICWFGEFGADYQECDVKLNNQMSFSNQDESGWNWSNFQQGRATNVHEFGHFIGLGHPTNVFALMLATGMDPVGGGVGNAEPYADDALGGQSMYGSGAQNIFASAFQFVNGSITQTGASQTIPNVCRGSTISVTYTVVNNGTVDESNYGFRIFVNDSDAHTGGWNMFNGTATSPRYSFFTETRNLVVPNVPHNGTYWILWSADTGNTVSEYNEGDNITHSATTINVVSC